MDRKDEIILQQMDLIRSMTERNLRSMDADFWGTPLMEKKVTEKAEKPAEKPAAQAEKPEQKDEKDFVVEMTMQDVFSVRMNVVSLQQAALLEQNFKKHAEEMYQQLLSTLTHNYEE